MAPGQPPESRAPPGLPSPGLPAQGSSLRGAERRADRLAWRALELRTPRANSQPVLRSAAPAAKGYTCAAARPPRAVLRGTAGRVTQRALRSKWPPAARRPAAGSERSGRRGPGGAACALPRAAAEPHRPRGAPCAPGPSAIRCPQWVRPDPFSSSAASTCAGSARRSRSLRGAPKESPRPLDLPSHGRTPATVLPVRAPPGLRGLRAGPSARAGPGPLPAPPVFPSALREPQAGMSPPDAAAKESLMRGIPTAFLAGRLGTEPTPGIHRDNSRERPRPVPFSEGAQQ